jgi:hypothetical protein
MPAVRTNKSRTSIPFDAWNPAKLFWLLEEVGAHIKVSTITNWNDLSSRRQTLLIHIEGVYPSDTFACSQLNSHLTRGTTTGTLNNLAQEDDYLRRWSGGSSMLLAIIPSADNRTAFRLSAQESLAQQMVNKEGISLNPTTVNWVDRAQRQQFAEEFNLRASSVELNSTWTRNKYRLKDDARYVVRANT